MRTARVAPLLAVLAAVAALADLAGCGAADAPEVASLPPATATTPAGSPGDGGAPGTSAAPGGTGAATPPAGSDSVGAGSETDTASGRPQFRLDDTDDRRTALVNSYSQCLIDHGATRAGQGRMAAAQAVPGGADGVPLIQVADPVPAAAKSACASRLPLMPPETEASTNPRFHEQSLAYVACLKKHGEWVQLLNDHDLDWTYVEGHPVPEDNAVFEPKCLLEAFGDGS